MSKDENSEDIFVFDELGVYKNAAKQEKRKNYKSTLKKELKIRLARTDTLGVHVSVRYKHMLISEKFAKEHNLEIPIHYKLVFKDICQKMLLDFIKNKIL